MAQLVALLFFPGGLFLLANGLLFEWIDRKMVARLQNRTGPRWFQPLADTIKLLANEEVVPHGVSPVIFMGLPVVALAGVLTAAIYIPMAGLAPTSSFAGDLIVVIYLLSLLTFCTTLAGAITSNYFAAVGAVRILTQYFAYEAPFLLALLAPAFMAGSWQISDINHYAGSHWLILWQPIGFVVAMLGLMGKLELPPFDAPEAETEIVAGALTEYSGRGLALFHLSRDVELVAGLTLIAAFYLGGIANPLDYVVKTLLLLGLVITIQTMVARLRIDQTVHWWWRYGIFLVLLQWLITMFINGG